MFWINPGIIQGDNFIDSWNDELLEQIMDLPGGTAFLTEVVERLEKDDQRIKDLFSENLELRQTITTLEMAQKDLELDVARQPGFFGGVGVGYPFGVFDLMVEYRFKNFSPYIFGVVGTSNHIGVGINFRLGRWN